MIKWICFYTVVLLILIGLFGCAETASRPKSPMDRNVSLKRDAPITDFFDPDRPPTAKTLYAMADILMSQGRDRDAYVILERILEEHPDFLAARNSMAELQMRNRRIPDAIHTLSKGLQINPNDPVLLNNLGMCWLIQKDFSVALDYFTQAAGLMPDNTRYRSNMATALALMNRDEEALSLYKQVVEEEKAVENIQVLTESRRKSE